MPDQPVSMILPAIRHRLSGLCVTGGLMFGLVLIAGVLTEPVSAQNSEPGLDAINDEIRDRQSRRLGLEEKAETIQNLSRRLRLRVIELARDIRNIDIEREGIEERLSELAVTESQLDAQLQRDRAALSRTLAGLQALETQPPPAFAVHPDDALAAVQGAIALASIVPSMQSRAQALRSQLVELVAIRAHMDRQSGELVRAEQDAAAAQRSIEVALAEKAEAEADIRAAAAREAEAIAKLVRQAKNLKDLAARLQKRSRTNPAPPPTEGGSFARARGLVPLPVIGQVEQRFGQADTNGQTVQGLAIAARPGAQITAPYDGRVLYSGAFRQYGGIVILGIDGNYQMILAGMDAPHSYVGQEVLTGEPLGNLPQGTGSLERSRLYLELRYKGSPIDPAPWIKNEKRSG